MLRTYGQQTTTPSPYPLHLYQKTKLPLQGNLPSNNFSVPPLPANKCSVHFTTYVRTSLVNVDCKRVTTTCHFVQHVWNVMAHAQKPDLVFQRNGRVHLNWRGRSVQSTTGSRGVRISSSNAGYTMFWGWVQDYWLPTPLARFPFTSPTCVTVCHQVSTELYLKSCCAKSFKSKLPTLISPRVHCPVQNDTSMEPLTSTKPHGYIHPRLGHFTESVQIRAPL